jgi:hypothetical protein
VKELKNKNNMPGGSKKGGGLKTKKSAFYLKSGNKASYSDLQVQKESPVKLAFLAPFFAMLGGGAITGSAVATTAAIAAGKAVAAKAVTSAATSTVASKLASGGGKKGKTPSQPIITEQKKIMQDEEDKNA